MEVYVARQPIFDRNRNVFGYEMLYRNGVHNRYTGINSDEATSHVIVNVFQNFGLSKLTDNLPVFINFTEKLIYEEIGTLFSPEMLIVEILETVRPTAELLARCRELKRRGYRIALDDYLFEEDYLALLEVADIIKVDFLNSSQTIREEQIKKYSHLNVEFLAEKIETKAEYELAKELGYKYFQGYYFSKPQVLTTQSVQPLQLNYLRLMTEVNKIHLDMIAIKRIISEDLGLTYSILKLINSPFFGIRKEVQSIEDALDLLSEKEIKQWVTLISLKGLITTQPSDFIKLSMQRAKFCELIAESYGYDQEMQAELFLMGLLSLTDVILGTTIELILEEISVSSNLRKSLLEATGPYYDIFQQALLYEKADWTTLYDFTNEKNLRTDELGRLYLQAVYWSKNFEII